MKVIMFSSKTYEISYFNFFNSNHELHFTENPLNLDTVYLAQDMDAICCFVTDDLNEHVIKKLADQKIKLIALRSAGFDHVNINAVKKYKIPTVRVPDYSPEAIAEMACALCLLISRKLLTAYEQVKQYNFNLENLIGFNLYQKTVGIVGTGKIGTAFAKIMNGFGCKLLAYDPNQNPELIGYNLQYVDLDELYQKADIISLHCNLNSDTRGIINQAAITKMKNGVILINTARGACIVTADLINALNKGKIAYAGLDVYENEKDLFFIDHHGIKPNDVLFNKLIEFPHVILTPHMAYLTQEAVTNIIKTTLDNISLFENGIIKNNI